MDFSGEAVDEFVETVLEVGGVVGDGGEEVFREGHREGKRGWGDEGVDGDGVRELVFRDSCLDEDGAGVVVCCHRGGSQGPQHVDDDRDPWEFAGLRVFAVKNLFWCRSSFLVFNHPMMTATLRLHRILPCQ